MNSPIKYITPRLGIIHIGPSTQIRSVLQTLENLHAHYYHVFNLSSFNLETLASQYTIPHTNFKWREVPFSISEAIKILATLEAFLRPNCANSAFFAVSSLQAEQYCLFVLQAYANILNCSKLQLSAYQSLLSEFSHVYKNVQIANPPIKVIQAVEFGVQNSFIPLYQIFNETRHNNFEPVYFHQIQEQLGYYYLQIKKPLKKGIGKKFCQKQPETKHLHSPCIVYGDVQFAFYSFQRHVLQKQFICGFNTKSLEPHQTVITIGLQDYYQTAFPNKLGQQHFVRIYISDFCPKCSEKAECGECLEVTKKIQGRYNEVQTQLQKLHRKRTQIQVQSLLGLPII